MEITSKTYLSKITTMLNERSTATHSTAIESYRRSKAKRSAQVKNELPNELQKHDIGWRTTFTVLFSILSIGSILFALLFMVQIFGAQF